MGTGFAKKVPEAPIASITEDRQSIGEEVQVQVFANILQALEVEFTEKERLSHRQEWCEPVPHERKVKTVQNFYKAFHDMKTLPTLTCLLCYRKYGAVELEDVGWDWWTAIPIKKPADSPFKCPRCFPAGHNIRDCADCLRHLRRGVLSPAAQLHTWLGCEHMFPDEMKGLTPVEEKLIALNSCYGFITRYSISDGHRQGVTYPRHVKGHITVFPNNVQELVKNVLPHPLLKVLDDIHVSWQGQENRAPSDLSALLSARRRVVEKALLWLKRHNHLYNDISIDIAEMNSWDTPAHGVPSQVFERLERNEPSAREKTQTAHIVPPTERGIDDHDPIDIQEIVGALLEEQNAPGVATGNDCVNRDDDGIIGYYLLESMGEATVEDQGRGNAWRASAKVRHDRVAEPYIAISRGQDFADPFDTWYLARAFPSLLPRGMGGPRQAEECVVAEREVAPQICEAVAAARRLVSSRNMTLEAWAKLVQGHGGRFASHPVFLFLAFNIRVRSRNRRASMASIRKSDFSQVESIIKELTAARLEKASIELESSGKTADPAVNQLLRSLSLYGYRQPMSRESRLTMRRKIKSLIVRYGIPAIWFTLNPNDITNPIKLKLAAYRTRETEEAEKFLRSLDQAYKRARLAISDPVSSAIFFHREVSMFFEHYVNVGEESVFGLVSQDAQGEEHVAYRKRVIDYVDSIFSEDLDEGASAVVRAERTVTAEISGLLGNTRQFAASFEEEANFCAGAIQVHTHSPTCVKYAIGRQQKRNPCRFGAPWQVVEKTCFTEDGLRRIRRSHRLVNRWNKAMAVGLRHNHDISFIVTKCKGLSLIYYVTNYATKVEEPVWKRIVAAKELIRLLGDGKARSQLNDTRSSTGNAEGQNQTWQFLLRVANRIFTERALSQVEVVAYFQGYGTEFTNSNAWAFLNLCTMYWHVFRRWHLLRLAVGRVDGDEQAAETVMLGEAGQRISLLQAYPHRGQGGDQRNPLNLSLQLSELTP
ncbi:hypothetical protein FOQG_17914 [Fusarium oxysporum f. sp. raphani 54005]|uniref:Uncharacterized protein n=1 Tax=Fusarium oxysporum f. sp. raphani 54005 TaxID=1089458 RepID=X0BEV2_FUSOX|nr:hypothetical protein FOQG_17914 [Fusarium oxysporum f. sp. raphani 54005]